MDNIDLKHITLRISAVALLAAAIINPDFFFGTVGKVLSALSPVFIGMAFAFVLNRPVCCFFSFYDSIFRSRSVSENHRSCFFYRVRTGTFSDEYRRRRIWNISVATVYFIFLLMVAGIIWIIIPQLILSLKNLGLNSDIYREKFISYYRAFEKRDTLGLAVLIQKAAERLNGEIPQLISGAYRKAADFFGGAADFIIGSVISVYILVDKDKLRSVVRNIAARLMSEKMFKKAAGYYRMVYDVFSRFVSGQITEAFILGVLCFIGMKLFRFDYALLISTIIGITALIPVVGAIIGTVPCAVLLFLVKPVSAVWFVVFIIVLQQLENNLIYPKVVGKSMGLPPLPVLLAILIGARFGGAVGILLAVPLTAVLYGTFKENIQKETK